MTKEPLLKVLLVEDDPLCAEYLITRMQSGFKVDHAIGLTKAKSKLRWKRYDAILLDVGLPDANRNTVVEEIKKEARDAAVIIMTGYEDQDFMRRAISQSASNYLVKGRDDTSDECLAAHIRTGIAVNNGCLKLDKQIRDHRQYKPCYV